MTAADQPEINPDKVRAVIAHAINGLPPEDRADRIAWCKQHGVHGAIMHPSAEDDYVEFEFGGHPLAVVPVDALTGDGPLELRGEFIAAVPDNIAELDDDA